MCDQFLCAKTGSLDMLPGALIRLINEQILCEVGSVALALDTRPLYGEIDLQMVNKVIDTRSVHRHHHALQ